MAKYNMIIVSDLDLDTLVTVVDAARERAGGFLKWVAAIDKAYDYLLTSSDKLQVAEDGTVYVPSATQNVTYAANGTCQCQAYHNNTPCWHRALARLIKRYQEATTATESLEDLEREADMLMHASEHYERAGEWEKQAKVDKQWFELEAKIAKLQAQAM